MKKQTGYVPLHVHSEYSLLDGAIKIAELAETAAGWGLPAVAITDHGNLFGAIQFYKKMTKQGIKPIMGCELYVAPSSRHSRQKEDGPFHLVALAQNDKGYSNLVELVSSAYTEGFYYRPRIDREIFEARSEGLIVLSACMKGEVPYYLSHNMAEKARETAAYYRDVLGPENYFIEIQENGLQEQVALNKMLVELARSMDLKLVATNDCHYLKKEDKRAHDILLCVGMGKTVNDPSRMRFMGELYFKSPEEMAAAFSELPESLQNTVEIAERCEVKFQLGQNLLPLFKTEDGTPPGEFLEKLVRKGMREKYGENPPAEHVSRLTHELGVIKKMGYESYFLIVWDFVNHAREKGIPVGPGRGSAAGSLVSYALGITEIDPMRYGLLFERFLNPERISMPDVDTDFCRDRRQEIINYVSERYGRGHVAQIITFGTLGAKAAIRDVGRALDIQYQEVDRIAKLVPEGPSISIREALDVEPALSSLYKDDKTVKELLDIAQRLEGISRHASTHAAGIVISPAPLSSLVPLYKNPTDGSITTQFDMGSIDEMGLVKFDLLGLKTLTIIDKATRFINEGLGKNKKENGAAFKPSGIPVDDKKTFELLGAAQSTGVFQLESAGMRDILTKMGPDRFEDLIALVALYRPGPIGSGMIDDFLKRKKGLVPVKYDLPQLKDILDETYGVILYQEQVMQIAHKLAGFSLGQADILRKAMGKKKPEEMEKQKDAFVKGSVSNGIPETKARKLFDLMAKFAEYGFNKSHSAAYAYIAYQTAYLKAHYPVEFMAATMSADLDNTDKIMNFLKECQNMSIDVLPPDINVSDGEFKVVGESIRFGMVALKGAGEQAIEEILQERAQGGHFTSFENFLERLREKKVNRKVMEALVKAGAFDSMGQTRRGCMEKLDSRERGGPSKQQSFFGGADDAFPQATEAEEWSEKELLHHEKEALGFYISGHPLKAYLKGPLMREVVPTSRLSSMPDKSELAVAGIIAAVKKIKTKNKGLMAALTLDDGEGTVEAVVFPDLYQENSELLVKDTPVLVRGELDVTDRGTKVLARHIMHLDDVPAKGLSSNGERRLEITLKKGDDLKKIKDLVDAHAGTSPLHLKVLENGMDVFIETSCKISPDDIFLNGLRKISGGDGKVRFF
ncbi:MAG: DNA polymerase III subunit alpha [Nitrospiraceae bacterium]|nr:DNA polymerase III subunit alpha [Nitrospiraceae bacterium]